MLFYTNTFLIIIIENHLWMIVSKVFYQFKLLAILLRNAQKKRSPIIVLTIDFRLDYEEFRVRY